MDVTSWTSIIENSFRNLWVGVAGFIPKLFIALVIFFIGWLVALAIDHLVQQIFRGLKVDEALRRARFDEVVEKTGMKLNSGNFIGGLVKWFVIVVFLVASFDVIGLVQVNQFLRQVVLLYLPQVIVAVLILFVAAIIANAMQKLVSGSAKASGIHTANFLGLASKWAIWIFAVLASLLQLGIATQFIETLFTGVVVAFSLAFGLSFGLGGQNAAAKYIEKIQSEIKNRD